MIIVHGMYNSRNIGIGVFLRYVNLLERSIMIIGKSNHIDK